MRATLSILAALVVAASAQKGWNNPCSNPAVSGLPFCDTTLSTRARAADLASRIPASDLPGIFVNTAYGSSSVQLPAYQWWSEALHGVAFSPGTTFSSPTPVATSFPQVCTTAGSFNATLFNLIGQAISTEARAFANVGHAGLTFWAPNVNIYRDPRWGRGQETPGEDPFLSSTYAANFVGGMQNQTATGSLKVSSCLKHYTAYDLENWDGVDRHHFNAVVTQQDLADTFMPSFQAGVTLGKASSIMCSYNEVNGVPSCADEAFNVELARNTWGFEGYITSDCGAISDIYYTHKFEPTTDATVNVTIYGGTDVDCGTFLQSYLAQALKDGAVTLAQLQVPLTNQFDVLMRLGLFDDYSAQPYRQLGPDQVNTPAHQQLALEAARQGIVLLQNNGNTLPFSKSGTIRSIALVGPLANATSQMQGNYYGGAPYLVSPLSGIAKYAHVNYVQGCAIDSSDTSGFTAAATAAANADATVIVVGLDQSQESEGHDRTSIAFPGVQDQFIQVVAAAAAAKGKPVVVVLMSGGHVDASNVSSNANVGAILYVGYPGQSGGQAIAEILFGDTVPSGRLINTMYPANYVNQVSMFDMNMRPGANDPGRSYRFYTGTPVFAFGTGESYTKFAYSFEPDASVVSAAAVQAYVDANIHPLFHARFAPLSATLAPLANTSITVTNVGGLAADDVVLAFLAPPNAGQNGNPIKYLYGFQRVHLNPGQSITVQFPMTAREFTAVNAAGERVVLRGEHRVLIGVGANEISRTVLVQ